MSEYPAVFLVSALVLPGDPIIYVTEALPDKLPDGTCLPPAMRYGVVCEGSDANGVMVKNILGVGVDIAGALMMAARCLRSCSAAFSSVVVGDA